jgi:hypothetical protein
MTAHCAPIIPSHSYFVVMVDYGRRGCEAVVDPEITRRGVIERIQSGEYKNVVFIHEVNGGHVDDLTDELLEAADSFEVAL